jgi:hypothetical protein
MLFAGVIGVPAFFTGCGGRGEPAPGTLPPVALEAPRVTDSLALVAPDGVTIWFAEARTGVDAAGTRCVERTLEIRRDTVRLKIPLLYTLALPTLIDDSTITAVLFRDCAAMATYRVGLRDGRPHRMPE